MRASFHKFSQKVLGEAGLRLVSTLFVLFLARTVGASEFGRYSTAMAYAAFCAVVVDLGTNSVLIREIARHPAQRVEVAETSHSLKLAAALGAWLLLAAVTYVISFTPEERQITLYTGITVIGYTLTDYFSALLNGLEEMGWEAILKTLSRLLAVAFAIAAIASHSTLSVITRQLAWGTLLSYAACVWIVKARFGSFGLAYDRPLIKSLLASCLPLFGSVLFWVLYDSQDVLLLNFFHFPQRDIGYFSAAMKVIEVGRVYPILLVGVFLPQLSKLHISDPPMFERKRKRLWLFMFLSISLLAATICIASRVIIRVLYKTDYMPAAFYLQLLTPALVLIGLNYTHIQTLIVMNQERVLLTGAWLVCAINLLLAFLLLPRYGVAGTCYALWGSELTYLLFLRRAMARSV